MADPVPPPDDDPELPRKPKSVAIFGAGIAGLTAAHELIERGYDVDVYEEAEPAFDETVCSIGGMARTQWGFAKASRALLFEEEDGPVPVRDDWTRKAARPINETDQIRCARAALARRIQFDVNQVTLDANQRARLDGIAKAVRPQ